MTELGPFCVELVRQIRARDTYGLWDGKRDEDLLVPFVVDKVAARAIPLIGDPDPAVLARLEQFYAAVALAIEQRSGVMASPLMNVSGEGFGRVVLTCGRLVAVSKTLRDVHRFGFPSLEKLEEAGMRLVEDGIKWIERFNQAATAD